MLPADDTLRLSFSSPIRPPRRGFGLRPLMSRSNRLSAKMYTTIFTLQPKSRLAAIISSPYEIEIFQADHLLISQKNCKVSPGGSRPRFLWKLRLILEFPAAQDVMPISIAVRD